MISFKWRGKTFVKFYWNNIGPSNPFPCTASISSVLSAWHRSNTRFGNIAASFNFFWNGTGRRATRCINKKRVKPDGYKTVRELEKNFTRRAVTLNSIKGTQALATRQGCSFNFLLSLRLFYHQLIRSLIPKQEECNTQGKSQRQISYHRLFLSYTIEKLQATNKSTMWDVIQTTHAAVYSDNHTTSATIN